MIKTDTLIVGGGLSGLSAAFHLKKAKRHLLIEKTAWTGGLAASFEQNGFTFDYSGHLLHLRDPYAKKLVLKLLGGNLNFIERNSWIYSCGVYTPYPFQANLYGLPPRVKSECVRGFLAAYAAERSQAPGRSPQGSAENFREWSLKTFGAGISKYFMLPYNAKLWQYPLDKLTTEWCAPFVPMPRAREVLEGAFLEAKTGLGYNPVFYYPKKGGIQALSDAFSEKSGNIRLNSELEWVDLKNKTAFAANIGEIRFKHLINTSPLKDFVKRIKNVPPAIKKYGGSLKHNTVHVLNMGTKKINSDAHWIYFPEKEFLQYRTGISSNFSRHTAPPETSSLYTEVAADNAIDLPGAEAKIAEKLVKCGILKDAGQIIEKMWLKIDCAYVIYDKERSKALPPILDYLASNDVFSIGRYGAWKYSFMEENILEGKETAERIISGRRNSSKNI